MAEVKGLENPEALYRVPQASMAVATAVTEAARARGAWKASRFTQ